MHTLPAPKGQTRRQLWISAAASACFSAPLRAIAQTTPAKLVFAGHAFLSNFAAIKDEFPHLDSLFAGVRASEFDRRLGQAGQLAPLGALTVEFDQLGRLGAGDQANVLALAFDREVILVTRIGDTWKLMVELSCQALVFDFQSRSVRASFPVATQYNDALDLEPTASDITLVIERLVFGTQPSSLISTFWGSLATVTLPELGARTLQVSQVKIPESAAASVASLGGITATLRDQIGYDFSKFLSANQRLSVLPYASSQAVGGKMAARLANGTVFNLTVPAPDYEIQLTLDGLKKVQTAATVAGTAWVYGAFVTVRVVEPLSSRVFFDSQVKLGATRTIPATAESAANDWPSFAEVLRQLFNEFTKALTGPDKVWAGKHLATADANLKPLKDLVNSCR